jgi:hypothetical protein
VQIPLGISFAFSPGSDKEVNAEVLRILLETLIEVNLVYLRSAAERGLSVPHLYDSGVRYGRTESWDSLPDLYAKGRGDCKSLTPAFVAQLRHEGHRALPQFRWGIRPADGGIDYHILVITDGQNGYQIAHDPSKVLGMKDVFS